MSPSAPDRRAHRPRSGRPCTRCEGLVVADDGHAVGGQPHVELEPVAGRASRAPPGTPAACSPAPGTPVAAMGQAQRSGAWSTVLRRSVRLDLEGRRQPEVVARVERRVVGSGRSNSSRASRTRTGAADPDVVEAGRIAVGVHRRRLDARRPGHRRVRCRSPRRAPTGSRRPASAGGRLVGIGVEVAHRRPGRPCDRALSSQSTSCRACSSRSAAPATSWWRWVTTTSTARRPGSATIARCADRPSPRSSAVHGRRRPAARAPAGCCRTRAGRPSRGRSGSAPRRPPRGAGPAGSGRPPPGGPGGRAAAPPCRPAAAAAARASGRRGCGCSASRRGVWSIGSPGGLRPTRRRSAGRTEGRPRPLGRFHPDACHRAARRCGGRWPGPAPSRPASPRTRARSTL